MDIKEAAVGTEADKRANGFAYVADNRQKGLEYENKYEHISAYCKQPFTGK